ncbi:MAG: hypothetical protein JWQ01_1907 [Massilia sp.]|nr:hypothetical protein [Massilia sp.]
MSYILEALKKSQAERQLGSAPTISAVPVGAAPLAARAASRRPAWIALSAVALAVVLALLAWRAMAPAPKPVPPVVVVPAPAVVAVAPPLAVVPPSTPPPKPVAKPAPVKAVAAPAAAPPAADDERLPLLREMPEAIQRTVPPLVFGGYMYSKNPADRLLLIDKALRHEGEEVAPGLVLEKLLPKAAVMNFNGYRYRVPY